MSSRLAKWLNLWNHTTHFKFPKTQGADAVFLYGTVPYDANDDSGVPLWACDCNVGCNEEDQETRETPTVAWRFEENIEEDNSSNGRLWRLLHDLIYSPGRQVDMPATYHELFSQRRTSQIMMHQTRSPLKLRLHAQGDRGSKPQVVHVITAQSLEFENAHSS